MSIFKCGIHNFETDSDEEWKKHEENEIHTITGNGACNYCGKNTIINYTGTRINGQLPVLCDDCKNEIENTKKYALK